MQQDYPVRPGGQGGYWFPGRHVHEDVALAAATAANPVTVLQLGDLVKRQMERMCSIQVHTTGSASMKIEATNDVSGTRWVPVFYDASGDPQIDTVVANNPARVNIPDTAYTRLRVTMWPTTAGSNIVAHVYCSQRRV